jgi:sialic acid synthase SpsE
VNYVEKADGLRESTNEIFNRLSLNKIFHKKIFDYARKKKIEIFSTPFDEKSVDYLEELNVNFYKIASVDIVNLPLIRKVGLTGKPLILSTGMSDFSTVEDAVKVFKETKNKNLILLHCLSSYPANKLEMNLRVIKTFKDLYKIPVGLSDHFSGVEISLMAIGMGANIIEKHFTLDKKYEGPDHVLSLEPKEMELLMNFSRSSNQIIGDGNKVIQPSEYEMINSQRKSIYAKVNILKGQKLSNKNICIKGPAGGIMPKFTDIILGKRIKKSIDKDMPITWEHI